MTSTALTVQEQRTNILTEVAEKYMPQIAALAPRGMAPEMFVAMLREYIARPDAKGNPSKLLECTPASIARGVLRVAQTGLVLGDTCDLLPFGKECQFSPRYTGIIDLALHSGVKSITAKVVRQGDKFEFEYGTEGFIKHIPVAKSNAPITHAYAIAKIHASAPSVFEVLTREEIDEIRARYSKQWKAGSLDAIPWYAKKTAVRRLGPYLPRNPRLAAALQYSDESDEAPVAEDGEYEILPDNEPSTSETPTETAAPISASGAGATPQAADPATETPVAEPKKAESSEAGELTLDQAKETRLIGSPDKWNGNGGKLLDSLDTKHLKSIRTWCAQTIENKGDDPKLQLMIDAITLIVIDREKDQASLPLELPADTPEEPKGEARADGLPKPVDASREGRAKRTRELAGAVATVPSEQEDAAAGLPF